MLKHYFSFLSRLPFSQFVFRYPKQMSLLDIIEESRLDWQKAIKEFNLGGRDVTDYLIYKIIAAERRYIFLLNQARAQKLTAWPDETAKPAVLTFDNFNNEENNVQDQ